MRREMSTVVLVVVVARMSIPRASSAPLRRTACAGLLLVLVLRIVVSIVSLPVFRVRVPSGTRLLRGGRRLVSSICRVSVRTRRREGRGHRPRRPCPCWRAPQVLGRRGFPPGGSYRGRAIAMLHTRRPRPRLRRLVAVRLACARWCVRAGGRPPDLGGVERQVCRCALPALIASSALALFCRTGRLHPSIATRPLRRFRLRLPMASLFFASRSAGARSITVRLRGRHLRLPPLLPRARLFFLPLFLVPFLLIFLLEIRSGSDVAVLDLLVVACCVCKGRSVQQRVARPCARHASATESIPRDRKPRQRSCGSNSSSIASAIFSA